MGYRSTFVTDHVFFSKFPEWFIEKWPELSYGEHEGKKGLPLASTYERKFYDGVKEPLFLDIARVIRESMERYPSEVVLVLLHEDGMVDRVVITANKVTRQASLRYDSANRSNPQIDSVDNMGEEYLIPIEDRG